MRRQLIVTVAAVVSMVLLAMLVPMAVLVRSYALEDRLSRAALEVQATETVVSGQDKGDVSVYVDEINSADDGIQTTVLYADGTGIGPNPGEDDRVAEARRTGQARVDDVGGGAQILVPVSLGGSTGQPRETPVIRVDVQAPGLDSGVGRAWLLLATLGVVLLAGALVLADRLGRSFVRPLADLADSARALGTADRVGVPAAVSGPPEVRDLAEALNRLVGRVEVLLERERQSVADLSHRLRTPMTALRLRVESVADPADRERLTADLDELAEHGRPRGPRGAAFRARGCGRGDRRRSPCWPSGRSSGVRWRRTRTACCASTSTGSGPVRVRASAADLLALLDALMDNVFTHTDDGVAVRVSISAAGRGRAGAGGRGRRPRLPRGSRRHPPGHQWRRLDGPRDVDRRGDGRRVRRPPGAGRTPTGGARAEVTLGPPV